MRGSDSGKGLWGDGEGRWGDVEGRWGPRRGSDTGQGFWQGRREGLRLGEGALGERGKVGAQTQGGGAGGRAGSHWLLPQVGIVLHYSTLSTLLWIGVTARNIYKQVTKKAPLCPGAGQPPYPKQPLLRYPAHLIPSPGLPGGSRQAGHGEAWAQG